MAARPLSIDIRNPLLLKANDLVLLTQEDGNFPLDVPGFGLFYHQTCCLGAYARWQRPAAGGTALHCLVSHGDVARTEALASDGIQVVIA